jgi:hypothetical protein
MTCAESGRNVEKLRRQPHPRSTWGCLAPFARSRITMPPLISTMPKVRSGPAASRLVARSEGRKGDVPRRLSLLKDRKEAAFRPKWADNTRSVKKKAVQDMIPGPFLADAGPAIGPMNERRPVSAVVHQRLIQTAPPWCDRTPAAMKRMPVRPSDTVGTTDSPSGPALSRKRRIVPAASP